MAERVTGRRWRHWRRWSWVGLVWLATGALAQGGQPGSAAARAEAARFWTTFREAALSLDEVRLAALTRLPLQLRGTVDGEPVRRVQRRHLLPVLKQLLAEESAGPGGGPARSQRAWIERKATLGASDWLAADLIRVQQMEFQRIGGRWYLVRVYADP